LFAGAAVQWKHCILTLFFAAFIAESVLRKVVAGMKEGRAALDRTAEGGCPHMSILETFWQTEGGQTFWCVPSSD
jgi:hypothetical protein